MNTTSNTQTTCTHTYPKFGRKIGDRLVFRCTKCGAVQ